MPPRHAISGTDISPAILSRTSFLLGRQRTPRKVDEDGVVTHQQGLSYAQQTSWFTTCLDAQRQIDLTVVDCLLTQDAGAQRTAA